jgi:hypothetical protein
MAAGRGTSLAVCQMIAESNDFIVMARQADMAPKKKETYKKPKKNCWHLYSLQALNPEKFIKVIDKILRKEFLVIK